MSQGFLPICKKDMEERGWEQLDFVYISGDAYVDHPSFGPAVITRLLEDYGYKVGIIAQPDWKDKNSITVLGEPRLAFLVSAEMFIRDRTSRQNGSVGGYMVKKMIEQQEKQMAGK